jgi:predicted metal-dependent hydrolase
VPSFSYQIVRKRGFATSASIGISSEKGVVIRAPFWMPKMMIEGFLEEKSAWIEKNLARLGEKKVVKKYIDGEKHFFFGKEYSLSILETKNIGRSKIDILEETIGIEIHDSNPKIIKEALLHWYLERGIATITEKVNLYTQKMGVNYQKINLKNVTSIWGSCSPSNCLSFNRKLVMAPHEVVDYVVIHEVAHLTHRNHGSAFWRLVASFDPEYKTHRKWLKLNHHLLSI